MKRVTLCVVLALVFCFFCNEDGLFAQTSSVPPATSTLNPLIIANTWEGDWFHAYAKDEAKNTHTVMQVRTDGTVVYIHSRTGEKVGTYNVEAENSFIVTFPNGYKLRFDLKGEALHGEDLKYPNWKVMMKQQK